MILDEALRGGAAEAEDDHVLEIAEETCENPAARKVDITGAHALDHLGRHGVHDVANQSDRGDDGCGLVDEGLVITSYRDTWLGARLFIDAVIIISFGEGQEECNEEGHHHQPMGNPDICGDASCQHAHHESYGNNRHVEDGNLLQADAVADIHQPVSRHYYI